MTSDQSEEVDLSESVTELHKKFDLLIGLMQVKSDEKKP